MRLVSVVRPSVKLWKVVDVSKGLERNDDYLDPSRYVRFDPVIGIAFWESDRGTFLSYIVLPKRTVLLASMPFTPQDDANEYFVTDTELLLPQVISEHIVALRKARLQQLS